MLWGKKEDKGMLPDLPPQYGAGFIVKQGDRAEYMPSNDEDEKEELDEEHMPRQDLPSFPDSMSNKGFSQAAIKDAVGGPVCQEEVHVQYAPNPLKNFKSMEMEEWSPSVKKTTEEPIEEKQESFRLGMPPSSSTINEFPKKMRNSDVFVKLDKFYAARKALSDAEQKLEDINEVLRKIRETKLREEQELDSWERELMNIKARMNELNSNLFEKVD